MKITDITPAHLKCVIGNCCPALYQMENGNLLIVGKKPSPEVAALIDGKIGDDELAIVMPPAYFVALPVDKLGSE